jgi:hypothetical protein
MDVSIKQPSLRCTQCGAGLDLPEGEHFFHCAHCSSALYLDRSRLVFHYVLTPSLDGGAALQTLRRWMASGERAKDLDQEAEIGEPELRYWPLWRLQVQGKTGDSVSLHTRSQPAVVAALGPLNDLTIPAGELRFHEPGLDLDLVPPSVSLETVSSSEEVHEGALVHVPLYFFEYRFRGRAYRAIVEGSSGQVLSERFPRRRGLAYLGTAILSFLLFSLVAFVAYLIMPMGGEELSTVAYALRCGVQLVVAVPLYFLARWVTQRV